MFSVVLIPTFLKNGNGIWLGRSAAHTELWTKLTRKLFVLLTLVSSLMKLVWSGQCSLVLSFVGFNGLN